MNNTGSAYMHRDRETLMVVEDDTQISDLLHALLTRDGYSVLKARDGKEALQLLQSAGVVPAVILVDLVMPRMGGLELIERLERDDTFCDIPVILLSGHVQLARGDKVRHLTLLPKPFRPDELLRTVRMLARQSSSRWISRDVVRGRAVGEP